MRRSVLCLCAAAALLAIAPATAQAQTYLSPFVGYDVGGDAGTCPSLFTDCTDRRTSLGVTLGGLIGGIFGFEEDFGYAPNFFGDSASFSNNSVLTLMSNVVVGVPIPVIRPYASGGIGLIRTSVGFNIPNLASADDNLLGYDVGGGVMILLPHHIGVKGDFRYFRSVNTMTIFGISLNNSQLDFSRASIALVLH
jgi:opacity protein-like surface antigen